MVRLADLLTGVPPAAGDIEITGVAYDHRAVGPGALFFCVRGFTRDGHDFAGEAVARGAVALAVERPLELDVPQVLVPDVRAAMAPAAAAFYGHPTRVLRTVGVTGTNGKTTTAHLTRALLEAGGWHTGLLGTVTSVVGGSERGVSRTTPEAVDLQCTLREMLDGGDHACVMEVSSHALALHRADAIEFAVAIFTNLTQDHLDFHHTMDEYFAAKRRLFTTLRPKRAVINVDDPYGARLAAELPAAGLITVALADPTATFQATSVETGLSGSAFTIQERPTGAEHRVRSPLPGRFNVMNVLAAFAAAHALGVPAETAVAALATAGQVPGRFEAVDEGQPFAVLVDYAHTPDSLENVLRAARALSERRVHVVFGCGGDRDRGKRPQMGEIAARLADRVFVTSDNPRSEDPDAIIAEILAGIAPAPASDSSQVWHNPDRRRAIEAAIDLAEPGDVVVIAGKGHERGQEFAGGRTVLFDDVAVARAALRSRQSQVSDQGAPRGGRVE